MKATVLCGQIFIYRDTHMILLVEPKFIVTIIGDCQENCQWQRRNWASLTGMIRVMYVLKTIKDLVKLYLLDTLFDSWKIIHTFIIITHSFNM